MLDILVESGVLTPQEASEVKKDASKQDVSIEEARKLNEAARELFFERNVDVFKPANVSTSTEASSSSPPLSLIVNDLANDASSTATSSAAENLNLLSIKDLVRSSLEKIKDAYQIFIEMSNLVRKLLG